MKTLFKIAALFLMAFLIYSYFLGTLHPDIESLRTTNPKRTAFMGDKSRPVKQSWVPLSQISRNLRQAVIVAEDGAFYQHKGIDFYEFKESLKKNAKELSFARGFSTISMQLARNLYLSPQKSVARKIKEIIIALSLEYKLTKDRILELYLNLIEWGRGIYGIEAAAQHYFDKSANSLSRYESAFLAAIIPSPQRLGHWPPSPYIKKKMDIILIRMNARWGEPQESLESPVLSPKSSQ
jgi:monofunctional biosynthetic peptidoglycan transglycosylase